MAITVVPKARTRRIPPSRDSHLVRINREAYQRIKQLSAESGRSIKELLSLAISHLRVRRGRKSATH